MSEGTSSGATEDLLALGLHVVEEAAGAGLPLRLAGSGAFAVRLASAGKADFLNRWPIRDLDFVCTREASAELASFFSRLGYHNDPQLMISTEGRRWTLTTARHPAAFDVFFDEMHFCQRLDLRGRITIDPKTLTLADLLLSKLQYVEPRDHDIEITAALLASHSLGGGDGDLINIRRICEVLGASWRFYYSASLNFQRIHMLLGESPNGSALGRLVDLEERVELWPKTLSWRFRSLAGTAITWYDEVGTTEVF